MSEHTVVDSLPDDAIPSIDDPTFGDSFEGNSDENRFHADVITWDGATGQSTDGRTLILVAGHSDRYSTHRGKEFPRVSRGGASLTHVGSKFFSFVQPPVSQEFPVVDPSLSPGLTTTELTDSAGCD